MHSFSTSTAYVVISQLSQIIFTKIIHVKRGYKRESYGHKLTHKPERKMKLCEYKINGMLYPMPEHLEYTYRGKLYWKLLLWVTLVYHFWYVTNNVSTHHKYWSQKYLHGCHGQQQLHHFTTEDGEWMPCVQHEHTVDDKIKMSTWKSKSLFYLFFFFPTAG